jgi:cold shock protein
MKTGTVRWFSMKKGYGFIEPDEGGGDVFININTVQSAGLRELAEGQKLRYRIDGRKNGSMAKAVKSMEDKKNLGYAARR